LGGQHQSARSRALRVLQDGIDTCPYCGRPMNRRQQLDLDDYPPRILAQLRGITPVKRLAHRRCNRSAGARLGNKLRAAGISRAPVAARIAAAAPPRRRRW
jgi:hypothetical protein